MAACGYGRANIRVRSVRNECGWGRENGHAGKIVVDKLVRTVIRIRRLTGVDGGYRGKGQPTVILLTLWRIGTIVTPNALKLRKKVLDIIAGAGK